MWATSRKQLKAKQLKQHNYKQIFKRDEGALLEIVVFDTTLEEWQCVLDYLRTEYLVVYTEDGTERPLPTIETVWQARDERSIMLEIALPGLMVNSHFLDNKQITMNILPEQVDSSEKGEAVFQLMVEIADLLSKKVFLTPEFGSATADDRRRMAVCVADPESRSIRCRDE